MIHLLQFMSAWVERRLPECRAPLHRFDPILFPQVRSMKDVVKEAKAAVDAAGQMADKAQRQRRPKRKNRQCRNGTVTSAETAPQGQNRQCRNGTTSAWPKRHHYLYLGEGTAAHSRTAHRREAGIASAAPTPRRRPASLTRRAARHPAAPTLAIPGDRRLLPHRRPRRARGRARRAPPRPPSRKAKRPLRSRRRCRMIEEPTV